MKLNNLISTNRDLDICALSVDSREVKPGYIFGDICNGAYVKAALENKASVIITSDNCGEESNADTLILKVDNPAAFYAQVVSKFYGEKPENICAVTGTNGKTSIADFVRQVLTMMGEKAASMGTLGLIKGNDAPIPSPNTTPNCVTVHKELKELKEEGFDYVIMEASSHGICQYRIGGIAFKAAGFTNLTRDHLDYHKTMENYLAAKTLLFTDMLVENGWAVLNADINVYEKLKKACLDHGKRIVSYGRNGKDIKLLKATPLLHGQRLDLEYFGKTVSLEIPLAGEFQAMNVLCAMGLAAKISNKADEVLRYITKIHGAKGRLELAGQTATGAAIYIDYAHTPDALENVIKAMRPHTRGKLHVLFGCGGDRDAGKRPIMGKIANDLADVVYVTDDNPRTENADNIRQQIMDACPKGQNIPNRSEAIKLAIHALQKGDVLILAGKGHETGQYINGKIYPFSDHEEVLKNL